MAFTYRIDLEQRRVFSTGVGKFSYQDAKHHMEKLLKDPQFDPTFSQLLDLTEIDTGEISPDQVVELAKTNVYSNQSRRAFVAAKPLTFGLARIFAAHRASRGETGIGVFSTLKEAQAWLDGQPEEDPPGPKVRRRARV
jgi:hypothetical protein